MRKGLYQRFIGLFLAMCLLIVYAPNGNTSVSQVQAAEKSKVGINYDKYVLTRNQTHTLKINGTTSKVVWNSSNTTIATVSTKGMVTGKADGEATITAKVDKKTYKCVITVTSALLTDPYEDWDHYGANYSSYDSIVEVDMKSAYADFQSVGYKVSKGIFMTVYSEKTICLEGLDSKGKSLGVVKNLGVSYIKFDQATKLRIVNPDNINYNIRFLPVQPTVISKKGNYTYSDFKWYKLKDGNIQAPVVFALKNSYYDFIADTEEESSSAQNTIGVLGYTPSDFGLVDMEQNNAFKVGYFTANSKDVAGTLKNLKIYVDQYKTVLDTKDIYAYGKTNMVISKGHFEDIISYRDVVKKIAGKNYLPDKTLFDKKLKIRYINEWGTTSDKNVMLFLLEDKPKAYLNAIASYYYLGSMDYGTQIYPWLMGTRKTIEEDALKALKLDTSLVAKEMSYINTISDENLKNFENYFVNMAFGENYNIGYHFIRFIQEEYGADVVYKINKKIMDNKQLPKFEHISPSNRTVKSDKIFIDSIKSCTAKDVFVRFVNEVVKVKMDKGF